MDVGSTRGRKERALGNRTPRRKENGRGRQSPSNEAYNQTGEEKSKRATRDLKTKRAKTPEQAQTIEGRTGLWGC